MGSLSLLDDRAVRGRGATAPIGRPRWDAVGLGGPVRRAAATLAVLAWIAGAAPDWVRGQPLPPTATTAPAATSSGTAPAGTLETGTPSPTPSITATPAASATDPIPTEPGATQSATMAATPTPGAWQCMPQSPESELSIATYNLERLGWLSATAADYGVRGCSIACGLGAPDIVAFQEVSAAHAGWLLAHYARVAGGRTTPWVADLDYAVEIGAVAHADFHVGVIYRRDRVTLLEAWSVPECVAAPPPGAAAPCPGATPAAYELYEHPPYVARFEVRATGGRINLVVNHWHSKTSATATRNQMAVHNVRLVSQLRAAEPDVPVIVLGDLNDDPDSTPIVTLATGADLVVTRVGPTRGMRQLDYILLPRGMVSTSLRAVPLGVAYPTPVTLSGTCQPGQPHQRASDHDPVLVRLPFAELPTPSLPPLSPSPSPSSPPPPTTTPSMQPSHLFLPFASKPCARTDGPDSGWPVRIDAIYNGPSTGDPPSRGPVEWLAFSNASRCAVPMRRWRVSSTGQAQEQEFTFSGGVIGPRETCRLHTGDFEPPVDDPGCDFSWSRTTMVWNDEGDRAEIHDPDGIRIDVYEYGPTSTPTATLTGAGGP